MTNHRPPFARQRSALAEAERGGVDEWRRWPSSWTREGGRCIRHCACPAASAVFRDKTNSLHGSLARRVSSNYDYLGPPPTLFSESHLNGFQRCQQCAKTPPPPGPLRLSTVLKGNKGLLIHSNSSNHFIIYYICVLAFRSASHPHTSCLKAYTVARAMWISSSRFFSTSTQCRMVCILAALSSRHYDAI